MRTIILGVAACGLLAACSGDAGKEAKKEAKADALKAGEYEFTARVDAVRSTDNSSPATAMKAAGEGAAPAAARVCVGDNGTIEPLTFSEAGDKCTPSSSYMRGGRMSLQFNCIRSGKGGLTHTVDGNFTADSFEAKVMTATYFSGPGDYAMTRTLTGKRVGDCPAEPPAAAQ